MYARHVQSWLRWSAAALIAMAVGFGAITLVRSAYQSTRKTDLTVYLRAAWAVRTGEDLYSVTDEHGWHYHYPPLVASLLVPFAQPAAGSSESALVPFSTVVILWYIAGLACVILALNRLAATVGPLGQNRAGHYRWWLIHVPVWVLLPALGSSLGRGQVNEWVLLLLAMMIVFAVQGRRFLAGVLLAAAACIKVIPLFLLIYPLWKRDRKWLMGAALGLFLGLFLLPMAMIGPSRTLVAYRHWAEQIVHPALASESTSERGREIFGMTATDNQSIQGAFHNMRHLDRATRPKVGDPSTKVAHWLIGAFLTAMTITAGVRSKLKEPHREALAISALMVPMLLISPVCHLHYFVLLLPLIIALIGSQLANGSRVRPALMAVLILNFFTGLLPRLPGCEYLRDVGLASGGALLLWAAALVELSGEAILQVRLSGRSHLRALKRRWAISHAAGTRTKAMPIDKLPSSS